jgi:hypothetical protein
VSSYDQKSSFPYEPVDEEDILFASVGRKLMAFILDTQLMCLASLPLVLVGRPDLGYPLFILPFLFLFVTAFSPGRAILGISGQGWINASRIQGESWWTLLVGLALVFSSAGWVDMIMLDMQPIPLFGQRIAAQFAVWIPLALMFLELLAGVGIINNSALAALIGALVCTFVAMSGFFGGTTYERWVQAVVAGDGQPISLGGMAMGYIHFSAGVMAVLCAVAFLRFRGGATATEPEEQDYSY